MSDGLVNYHPLLSDWSFLIAAVVFLALAVLAVLRSTDRPPAGTTDRSTAARGALPWLALALVAFGLLVL